MKRQSIRCALAIFVIAVAALGANSAAGQTLDEILTKNYAARGGLDKIKAVQTITMTGYLEFGGGMQAPFVVRAKRPSMTSMEFNIQGMMAKQVYDGKNGWELMPFEGKKDPAPMEGEDLKNAEDESDIDGPLVDYQRKGVQIELVGKDVVNGAPAYKLKIARKNGDIEYDYVDASSFLEIQAVSTRVIQGAPHELATAMSDYRPIQGVYFPFKQVTSIQGSPQTQKLIVEKIVLNEPIDDSVYKMPAAPPADAKPGETKPPAANAPGSQPPMN